ncbi:portal protein [Sphingomonas sp. MMS24-JH45]
MRWEGGELAIETVEEQPFSVFCPFPRPHRIEGWSLADKVMDIQLARSTIARQLMDGMYNANMPRPVVSETGSSENTMDDILSPVPGAPIRVRDVNAVTPFVTSFDVGKSMTVLEWMTGERENRTGITRLNQGLDADALNKTATGTALMQAQGQQQEEFIARNLAEAVSRLFGKKYRLMRREGDPFPSEGRWEV